MEQDKRIEAEELLQEIKISLKDDFVASVRKRGDELVLQFTNGQKFAVTVWEEN